MIVPPGKIPSVDSDVLVVSGAVPVPVAGEPEVPDAPVPEELELVEAPLDDEEAEPPDEPSNTCCTSAVIWLLTRFKAVALAMLARPFARLVSAVPITLMSAVSALDA